MTPRRGAAVKRAETEWCKRIKAIRQEAGISQQEMAEQLGMTFSNYTKIERGVIGCRLGVAIQICRILGIEVEK